MLHTEAGTGSKIDQLLSRNACITNTHLPDVVEVSVWYALLCSQLCFLVEEDVKVEPRFQELKTLKAQRFNWACARRYHHGMEKVGSGTLLFSVILTT